MESLTTAQQELYDWLINYIRENRHSPSIRQMRYSCVEKDSQQQQNPSDRLMFRELSSFLHTQYVVFRYLA